MAKTVETFFAQEETLFSSRTVEKTRLQKRAWKRFQDKKTLLNQTEAFRFFPLDFLDKEGFLWPEEEEISKERIASSILPGFERSYVVFINGRFIKGLSCLEGIEKGQVLSSKEAENTYALFLENQFRKKEKREQDPFVFHSEALSEEGVFIYLPEKKQEKIQIVSFITGPFMVFPKIQMVLAEKAELTCYISYMGDQSFFWENSVCEVFLQKEAKLTLKRDFDSSYGASFHAFRSFLEEGAILDSFQFSRGQKLQKSSYKIELEGENSRAFMKGVNLAKEDQNVHTQVEVFHKEPSAFSEQDFKIALKKGGEHHFEGLIYVEPKAQKTESYQLCKTLLLEEGAFGFARPKLEIFADDVKASHGATLSRILEEDLFYLQSRGIEKGEALSLLATAFLQKMEEETGLKKSFFLSSIASFMEG